MVLHLIANLDAKHTLTGRVQRRPKNYIAAVTPPKSNRRFPATFEKETRKWRHLVENFYEKLGESRRIAERSCKTDQSIAAFIPIAAPLIQNR